MLSGEKVLSKSVACYLPEGAVAKGLSNIQQNHTSFDIGSYPFKISGKFGCTLVCRGTDEEELETIISEISELIFELGGKPIDEDLVTPEDEKRPDDY